jgi:hypothetical protein
MIFSGSFIFHLTGSETPRRVEGFVINRRTEKTVCPLVGSEN